MSSDTTVAQEIDADAPNPLVKLVMRFGALLEGGSLGAGPFAVGDQGHSHGPFQINLPYHPGVSAAQAEDPSFAVQYMLPSYLSAVRAVPQSVWQANPELAAEEAVQKAERPATDYFTSEGTPTVDSKWKIAGGGAADPGGAAVIAAADTQAAGGSSSTSGGGCDAPSGLSIVNPGGWVGYFFCKLEEDAKPALFTGAAVLAGTALVVGGLWRSVSHSETYKTAKQQVQSAGPALAMAAA